MNKNICAIVTTFCPDYEIFTRLKSTLNQVEFIILVDDSGRNLSFNIPEDFINNLLVINNESNFGIAKSLNLGVHKARQLGYELILTLDDDTRLDLNYVNELKPFLFSSDKVSLVCGVFGGRETEQSPYKSTSIITSGSLFSLDTFDDAQGFTEKLFIDYVDFDFCLKINKSGGSCWVVPSATYLHTIGKAKEVNFVGLNLKSYNHEPFRIYYQTRNAIYILMEHFSSSPIYSLYISRNIFLIAFRIIAVDDNKIDKIKMYFKGLWSGILGRYGKLL